MNQKKYVILLAGILALISVLGILQADTKHFEYDEISFDYPASFQQLPVDDTHIAAFKDPYSESNITISRQKIPSTKNIDVPAQSHVPYTPNKGYVISTLRGVKNDYKPISNESGKISGVPYTLNTYNLNINGRSVLVKELWLQKNNALYSIIYKQEINNLQLLSLIGWNNFDLIKNSLRIDNKELNETPIFANVTIPRLGINWNIRTDSINTYNSVYHYSESFYPGQKGSIGLMGHQTTYSAPFKHIEMLQIGDKVYINDYLTQKKYVYSVTNNSDIRYDYNTNKIRFHPNSGELILATCWPPETTEAGRYVHCKLESVEPL